MPKENENGGGFSLFVKDFPYVAEQSRPLWLRPDLISKTIY